MPSLDRFNMRRGLLLGAAKQALIFFVLVALVWSLRAVRVVTVLAECPLPPVNPLQLSPHVQQRLYGRLLGPGFGASGVMAARTVQIR